MAPSMHLTFDLCGYQCATGIITFSDDYPANSCCPLPSEGTLNTALIFWWMISRWSKIVFADCVCAFVWLPPPRTIPNGVFSFFKWLWVGVRHKFLMQSVLMLSWNDEDGSNCVRESVEVIIVSVLNAANTLLEGNGGHARSSLLAQTLLEALTYIGSAQMQKNILHLFVWIEQNEVSPPAPKLKLLFILRY